MPSMLPDSPTHSSHRILSLPSLISHSSLSPTPQLSTVPSETLFHDNPTTLCLQPLHRCSLHFLTTEIGLSLKDMTLPSRLLQWKEFLYLPEYLNGYLKLKRMKPNLIEPVIFPTPSILFPLPSQHSDTEVTQSLKPGI